MVFYLFESIFNDIEVLSELFELDGKIKIPSSFCSVYGQGR